MNNLNNTFYKIVESELVIMKHGDVLIGTNSDHSQEWKLASESEFAQTIEEKIKELELEY